MAAIVDMMNPPQHKSHVIRNVRLFGGVVILSLILLAIIAVYSMREREIEDWRKQLGNMSLILAEQTSQSVFAAYQTLDAVTERVKQAKVTDQASFRRKMASREIYDVLHGKVASLPQLDVATIVAANGDNLNFSRSYPVPPINLAERDYFKAHRDNPKLGDFISQPVRNKGNGKWTFYISRRLDDAAGNFMGLVLIGVSVEALTNFYERLANNMGEGASMSLYRSDLMLMARWPGQTEMIGKINKTGTVYEVIELMKKNNDVILRNTQRFATGEAVLRLSAVRATERYPFIVALIVTEDLFLASWRRSAWLIAGMTLTGVVLLFVGLITLLRNLEQREADMIEMGRLKTEAESANLAKSKFLATMSHEIRTPMNGMLGMAQLLMMPQVSEEERHEFSRTILNSGQTLLTLLNDILDLSKVEAGKLDLLEGNFDPQQALLETSALFAEPAHHKGLDFKISWEGPPEAHYLADPIRIRQMLSNLLSNGIKFTAQGFVHLTGREIRREGEDALLEFSVTDSGIGIPPEKQELLFKPFSQADSSTTREYGGSGLGLSIVRSLSLLMGGNVGLESEAGRGSRFWFSIRVPVMATPDLKTLTEEAPPPNLPLKTRLQGKVLIVEDNATNRKVIESLLKKMGLQTEMVENGQEAVNAIQQGMAPDLVLMDIQMPVMDGLQASAEIRRLEKASGQPPLPVIALTAGAFEEDRQNCKQAGMSDFLAKPINKRDLEAVLARWLRP